MSDWIKSTKTESYQEAVRATQTIEEPSIGFLRPSEARGGATAQTGYLIKQNNTIIQLLIQIAEKTSNCLTDIQEIKREIRGKQKEPIPEGIEGQLDEIQKRLEDFHVGDPKPVKKKSPFFVFKDPLKIFEDVKKTDK